jgi:hypothetical protein
MSVTRSVPVGRLILAPAVITLVVTVLRLIGELMNWSPGLFNKQAGGAFAIVGIVWLVPVFGVYFAVKLLDLGHAPASAWRVLGYAVVALAVPVALSMLTHALHLGQSAVFLALVEGAIVSLLIAMRGWPALGRTLFAYGLAARIPVAIVMLFASLKNWGTHYDAAPAGFPTMEPLTRWFLIGLLPQVTVWVSFTVVIGALFAGFTVLGRKRAATV